MAKNQYGVVHLKLEEEEGRPFHSAVNDAYYTGLVLRAMSPRDLSDRYCYDIYNNPKEKKDEIISHHKHYLELISKEYKCKVDAIADTDLMCPVC